MLIIEFTGVVAFREEPGTRISVVFSNVSSAQNIHQHLVPAHTAFIKLPADARVQRKPLPNNPPYCTIHTGGNDEYFEVLNRLSLSIEPSVPTPPGYTFDSRKAILLENVIEHPEMDDALVSTKFDPNESRVSARLDINRGDVVAVGGSGDNVVEFVPRLRSQTYRDNFAEIIQWTLPAGAYEVNSVFFGAPKGTPPITRWEIDATGADPVRLTIGNLPVLEVINPSDDPIATAEPIDYHFHLYYSLCKDIPDVHPLPHRVSARPGGARVGGENCPPAVMK